MTTAAQTTLLHAAELLEAEVNSLRSAWGEGPDAIPMYEDLLITALELRLLARRRLWGITPELRRLPKAVRRPKGANLERLVMR